MAYVWNEFAKRPAPLVSAVLVAVALSALAPTRLAGSELSGAPPATANPFLEGAGDQVSTCGGPGQRACCLLERGGPNPVCDEGLRPVPLNQFPNACVFGADTCMPVSPATACGGEGQRACCIGEGPTCQTGLEYRGDDAAFDFFVPVSGDATCSNNVIAGSTVERSAGICVKLIPDPIPEPVTNWAATAEPRGVLRGYMDMHLHLLGHMAHGGSNLAGEPAPLDGQGGFILDQNNNINSAMWWAKDFLIHKNPFHGMLNDTSGEGTGDGARSAFGAPYFSGWPKWTSTTHQQTYYVWLERAWRGGLRATTLFASHVESLCKTSLKSTRETSWPMCEDSMLHIVEQLKAAQEFEKFVDRISGGPGRGWFRIVTTPQQARDTVRAGKLAVVLGIEVDNLFNCKEAGCPADFGLPAALIDPLLTGRAAPTTLEEAVNVIYDMGVRQVFPVHNFDNGFGGAATWMDPIGVGQAIGEQRWWVTRDCGDGLGDYGFWLDNAVQDIMLFFGFGVFETPPLPFYINGNLSTAYASCNVFGLRPLGAQLIHALMNKGMLIDIDHMSANSADETITLTAAGPDGNGPAYPLLASHVQPFELHQKEFVDNKGRHERMRTRAQLDAIRASGGMVAAMLKDDVVDTGLKGGKYSLPYVPLFGGTVADNCRHSSKTWAQAFQYEVDVMGGPVAMGSDFNGAAGHVGPRFGSDACGGWGAANGLERPQQIIENSRMEYPFNLSGFGTFDQQVTGFKAFDYNVDGLAHIGLLPDMVADLERIGMNQHYLDSLFCSAEAYIRVWERADALGARRPVPDPNRPWLCNVTVADTTAPASSVTITPDASGSGWHRTDVVATITATDADSGVDHIDYSVTGAPIANGPVAGDVAGVTIAGEGDRQLSYFATDLAGNVESPNALTVRIDRMPPVIEAARAPAANAAGWNNSDVTVAFHCTDALSGIDTCAASQALGSEGANQSAGGEAVDLAGNSAGTSMSGINIDLTAPVVAVTGVSDGAAYDLGSVPQAGCTTSDALSGVDVSAVVAVSGGTSNTVGTFSVTCTGARDRADNAASASATYAVHYVFSGFMAPVAVPPMVNTVRAGQTVPVKFSLSGNYGLGVLPGGTATSAAISCGSGATVDLELGVVNPGASQFAYDPLTGLYQFNWKTDRSWSGSCRRLFVRLDDGTAHTADFRLQ